MTRSLTRRLLLVCRSLVSRLQQGLAKLARWADFRAGSEVPNEARESVDNELDEVTEYVFEVIQNSNFGQEVHESSDSVGTGVLSVTEGDAINPIVFSAVPCQDVLTLSDDALPRVVMSVCVYVPLMYKNANW